MIEIEVTTRLSTSDFPWDSIMEGVSLVMLDKIQQNFLDGGRVSPWTPKKDGGTSHLIKTGTLFNSLRNSWDKDSAKVSTSGGLPYVAVHNYGGFIEHPGSDKLQAFTVAGKEVVTHGTKPHSIYIPQREYMVLGEQDIAEIVQYLEAKIVNHLNDTKEVKGGNIG